MILCMVPLSFTSTILSATWKHNDILRTYSCVVKLNKFERSYR